MTNILKNLLFPISVNDFFQNFWEKEFLYLENDKSIFYNQILSKNDLNSYLSKNDIRYPNLRMIKNGFEVPLNEYAYEYSFAGDIFQGNIDIDKVFYLYSEGSTINLQLLEKLIDNSASFANKFEEDYSFPIQLHAFISPPFSTGFTEHYDTNSFFILQLEGQKTWEIYDAPFEMPLLKHREYIGDKNIDKIKLSKRITLKKGQLLYIPCGVYHKAITQEESSIHLTIGLLPQTWSDIMHKIIDNLSIEHISFRKSFLNNSLIDKNHLDKSFNEILKVFNTHVNIDDVVKSFKKEVLSKQLYDSKNRFKDLLSLTDLNEETTLKVRAIHFDIQQSIDMISIFIYDKSISISISYKEEIDFIFSKKVFKPLEINTTIDTKSKVELCRILLSEGLLTVKN